MMSGHGYIDRYAPGGVVGVLGACESHGTRASLVPAATYSGR
jgi:hypothetical protein